MDPVAKVSTGCWICAVFTVCSFTTAIMKRSTIQTGLEMSMRIRKILMSSIYDKIGKLSMKAVTSTNSGKLISLVSADCFMMERGLAFAPIALTVPITNIAVIIFLSVRHHWSSGLVVLAFWLLMLLGQNVNGQTLKGHKFKEGMANDRRIKLVSDMVNGIRTIKSYGWEDHYKKKIFEVRKVQEKHIWLVNLLSSMGLTVFNNFGFYAYLVIVVITQKRGVELKAGE